ncbi:MAG: hypothetical protein RI894_2128 [Bacteroidota bacterium]
MAIIGALIQRGMRFGTRLDSFRNNDIRDSQRKTLRRLLRAAQQTSFGKHYNFKKIGQYRDVEAAFQQEIPCHDYNAMYEKWWHRTVAQEPNVCWTGVVDHFALSSGTSGAPSKYIPITTAMTRAMHFAGRKMFFSLCRYNLPPTVFEKGMMMVGGSADLHFENGFYSGDLSGINANRLPYWLRQYYAPGVEIAKISDWNTRMDAIAKNAHNWDIGFMTGIPSWLQLMMERVIDLHKIDTIHDIWPNFEVYVSGGVALGPYKKSMDRLFKKPVTFIDTYLASEGFIAFQNRPNAEDHAMALIVNNGIYFEFVPFNEKNFDFEGNLKPGHEIYTVGEVKTGIDYAILLTTCAGAWRYLIGDTVRFTNTQLGEIHITGRTKHFLSITGEHLSVDNMNRAIQLTADDFGVSVREFTVAALPTTPGHFEHRWYVGCEPAIDRVLFQARLDNYLKAINDDYRTERSAFLGLKLETIPLAYFYEFQAKYARLDGQAKFPRVMKSDKFKVWEEFIQSKK